MTVYAADSGQSQPWRTPIDTETTRGRARVQRSPLNSQVADLMRDDILSGRLKPGERIVQAEWAERLSVSRMPVRDAINQLCMEGILRPGPGGTAEVVAIEPDDIRDGYLLNSVVAALAARRAAVRITDGEIARLREIHEAMQTAVAAADATRATRLNWEFHSAINHAAHSARLLALLRILATSIPHNTFRVVPDWPARALEHHAEIIEALAEHRADDAAKLMRSHVERGSEGMIAELRGVLFPDGLDDIDQG